MKGNLHKKVYDIDEFARYYYCDHARLNALRTDKRNSKRKVRRYNKELIRKATEDRWG